MDIDALAQVGVPAITGLITGGIGSLIAPWINWGVEKRRRKHEARRNFIEEARNAVVTTEDARDFRERAIYSQLKPYLSKDSLDFLTTPNVMRVEIPGNLLTYHTPVLEDISRLEAKWDLL
jgi:hypothetical protein